jgi:hypothetical protein
MAFRKGQWVKTTRDLQISASFAGQSHTITVPAPSVGIYGPILPGRTYHREGAPPIAYTAESLPAGLCELALVDGSGMVTILEAAIPPDAIEPVTELADIPEVRRSHCAPGWTPKA